MTLTLEQLTQQTIIRGWIKPCIGEVDVAICRRELELLGVKVGVWDMFKSEFEDCSVSAFALADLDSLWGKYIWGVAMTTEQLAALTQIAEKATPGPWRAVALLADAENHHVLAGEFSDRHIKASADDGNGLIAFADLPANTEFIAAFDPTTCKELLEEVERLRETMLSLFCCECGKKFAKVDEWSECATHRRIRELVIKET